MISHHIFAHSNSHFIRGLWERQVNHHSQLSGTQLSGDLSGDFATGSALAIASDIHRQVPTYMADIRCEWLTNQNTDCCFVVIGLVGRQSHIPLLQLKIDPVRQMGPSYWLAPSRCQRIFINIRGQYGIQKNIFIHPCVHATFELAHLDLRFVFLQWLSHWKKKT